MKVNVKAILTTQAEWQKSRKTASWGDKIRQSEAARNALSTFSYKPSQPPGAPGENKGGNFWGEDGEKQKAES